MDESEKKYEFIWRIENFNPRLPEIGNEIIDAKCLASPNFLFYIGGYSQWYVELYPTTGRNGAYLKCLPICMDYDKDHWLTCEISLLGINDSVHATKKTKCKCSGVFHCDFSNALEVERSKLPLQRDLIIRCTLSFKQSDIANDFAAENDVEELSEDMLNLYKSRYLSDLTLCTGKNKFFVHRTVICIRAPKFSEILGIQDVEDFQPVVRVDNLSFHALKCLITYFYTGKIDVSTDSLLPELYDAVNAYHLNRLKYEIMPEETHSVACTKIDVSKQIFSWKIKDFNNLEKPEVKIIDLQLSKFIVTLTPTLESCQLTFKIISFPENKQVYLICKMCVVDKAGNFGPSANHTYQFESDTLTKKIEVPSKEKWNFPTLLNKKDLISNEDEYLPNGILNLHMELEITEGEKVSEITKREISLKAQNTNILHMNYLSSDLLDIFKFRNRPGVGGEVYDGDCYNDAILEVEGKEVFCHKSILCARSKVFTQLFSKTSVNSEPERVQVIGIDYYTVLLMIHYMYSGQVTNVAAMEIARLYLVANKYKVLSLTNKCISLLEQTLTLQNVCDVLSFSYDYENETLLKPLYDFIRRNETEVFNSDEWKELVELKPVTTSVVHSKIVEKRVRAKFYRGSSRRGFTVIPRSSSTKEDNR